MCTPIVCELEGVKFVEANGMEEEERLEWLQIVKDMFYHAYHGYMEHAFPSDNLLPLTCRGGEFALSKIPLLTLIDALDMLAILEDRVEFERGVRYVIDHSNFDIDENVSVFETTIRVLGGLLSAHMFAINKRLALLPNGMYKNELLTLAIDIADRLMPAFQTKTGIPYGTVNLRRGVPIGETTIASSAGAGSLTMEFTMLSALTGDIKYANASRVAARALNASRSSMGLLGKHIDNRNGDWYETLSGPGSNSDSVYEYFLKMYMNFGDVEFLHIFEELYDAIMTYNRVGDWFFDMNMYDESQIRRSQMIFENLVAFFPGLQVAFGQLSAASNSLNAFHQVWREFGFTPERFDVQSWDLQWSRRDYVLRPELAESTFYMHEATQDSSWLRAGAHIVESIENHCKTDCGYASVKDVETKQLKDEMPSFFLAETCKYLYLLFNTSSFIRNGNFVFTTEAHPFPISQETAGLELIQKLVKSKSGTLTDRNDDTCSVAPFWLAYSYQEDYHVITEKENTRLYDEAFYPWSSCELHTEKKPSKVVQSHVVNGGEKLGDFYVHRVGQFTRVTQEQTQQWIDFVRYGQNQLLVAMMPAKELITTSNSGISKAPLVPVYRTFQLHTAPSTVIKLLSFTCSVQVLLDLKSLNKEHHDETTAFRFPCMQSKFGGYPFLPHSIAFAMAGLVIADPIDACTTLQGNHYRGKYVLANQVKCSYEEKSANVDASGAFGLLIWIAEKLETDIDDVLVEVWTSKRPDGTKFPENITIPIIMVSHSLGKWLDSIKDTDIGIRLDLETFVYSNFDISQLWQMKSQDREDDLFFMISAKHFDKVWLCGPQWSVEVKSSATSVIAILENGPSTNDQ
ncbi:unnamed protein product [Albugo candida]|uniref:alpha-1,2-Mannosidase n=1 Tax=Albugo candida TaxID=65357 RepID=A0A024G3N5_9STRA|nr:unnamed protein product [Albugo candida]|eukprot:CCI41448.1 unnamed protein product [Albugo candida]